MHIWDREEGGQEDAREEAERKLRSTDKKSIPPPLCASLYLLSSSCSKIVLLISCQYSWVSYLVSSRQASSFSEELISYQ